MTPPGALVRSRASPPPASIRQTCRLPVSSGLRKASVRPSGENLGTVSLFPWVNSRLSPPGRSNIMIRDRLSIPSPCSTQDWV